MLDVLATYVSICMIKNKYPKTWNKRYGEANAIVNYFWKKYGIHKGTRYSVILLSFLLFSLLVLLMFLNNEFFLGVVIGIYMIVLYIHFLNFKDFYEK